MKMQWKKLLPALMYFLGGVGCMLRLYQYRYALDEKGLLISRHPLNICLILVAVLAMGLALYPKKEKKPFEAPEAPFWLPGIGSAALAAGLLALEIPYFRGDLMEKTCNTLKLVAAVGQLWAAWSCFRKKEPFFGCNGLTCLFFVLLIVCAYPVWSSDPQTHRYLLYALALMGLAITAYGQAAFATGLGWPKGYSPTVLLTVFVCLTAIPESDAPVLLLTGAIWAACILHRPVTAPETPEV